MRADLDDIMSHHELTTTVLTRDLQILQQMTYQFATVLPIGTQVFNLSNLYGLKGKYNLVQWGFEIRTF